MSVENGAAFDGAALFVSGLHDSDSCIDKWVKLNNEEKEMERLERGRAKINKLEDMPIPVFMDFYCDYMDNIETKQIPLDPAVETYYHTNIEEIDEFVYQCDLEG